MIRVHFGNHFWASSVEKKIHSTIQSLHYLPFPTFWRVNHFRSGITEKKGNPLSKV